MVLPTDKIFLLSRRWPHHNEHSGYDLFSRAVGLPLVANPIPDSILPDRILRRLQRHMLGYDRNGVALELLAGRHMATHRGCLYHFLYGDNGYQYLGRLNGWRGHRLIATFHHPPQKFAKWVQDTESLKRLSAAIILGRNQYSSLENILPRDRIFFVPYAIDTSYFTPPLDFSHRQENLCLFVGSHLRDFRTLKLLIEDARVLAPRLTFAIVTNREDAKQFRGVAGNFTIYTDIQEDLLRLYQEATILIEPLLDAVANTALLEAMACGLPMVVTEVGAVRDYVSDSFARLVPPFNSDAMLAAILHLVDNPDERKRMSTCAREQALLFDWQILGRQMRKVYEQVFDSPRSFP